MQLEKVKQNAGAVAAFSERVRGCIADSKAASTKRAYKSDWADFAAFCDRLGVAALPASPDTVTHYIVELADAGRKASTIGRRLQTISQAHKFAGHPSPNTAAVVSETWKGLRRQIGTAQEGKRPIMLADLRAMVDTLPDTVMGKRDRAILLLGFAGAFRRSELVGLDVADIENTSEGFIAIVRRSKTDQEGQGTKKGIPFGRNIETCPVKALEAWLTAAGVSSGPLFAPMNQYGHVLEGRLSDKGIARIVKRAADAAGLDSARFSGHSLRAGLATQAASSGASERAIMNQTGHKSLAMVRRYIREGSLFRDNAAAAVGM